MDQINNHLNNKPGTSSQSPGRHWPLYLHRRGSWLVIALVLLVLGLASYLGLHTKSNSPHAPAFMAQVSITAAGFSPSSLSVKSNTLVTWTNTDSKPHEVAADPYPKNDSILNFDSSVVLQTNDTYSFNFSKKGTYHYHDQLNPFKINGTVIVK